MKVVLQFDLDQPDEEYKFRLCSNGKALASVIWLTLFTDADEFRSRIEQEDLSKITSPEEVLSLIYQRIWDRLNEEGILLERWYS